RDRSDRDLEPVGFRGSDPHGCGGIREVRATDLPVGEGGEVYHVPVMVREVVGYLRPERGGLYFDGTLGGGGHSAAILEAGAGARVIGVDRDPEAVEAANRVLARFGER